MKDHEERIVDLENTVRRCVARTEGDMMTIEGLKLWIEAQWKTNKELRKDIEELKELVSA